MPLFKIRRSLPGAVREDVDAAAYRALACAFNFEGMRWVTSYWDREGEEFHCIYEAQDAAQLAAHARRARIPCDDVCEVIEIGPELYVQSSAGLETVHSSEVELDTVVD
jgi:hypothetical protein